MPSARHTSARAGATTRRTRLALRAVRICWRALVALGILFSPFRNLNAAATLDAEEAQPADGRFDGEGSFDPVPPAPINSKTLRSLREILREKMEEMDAAERAPASEAPPVQMILPEVVPPESADTNALSERFRYQIHALADAARRARLLGEPTNSVPPTNAQTFEVKGYELTGNTLLSTDTTALILRPYIRPKIDFVTVRQGLTELQKVYADRGYATVAVTLPQQTLTNGIVKIRVFEGKLATIKVVNNHFFSSNNVMRALPGIHTNMILNSYTFQAELDRANVNQDRQIYPQIEPGEEPGTTDLRLQVKDRIPLHAKIELNNENSPGTPDLRVNSSAVFSDLWQLEHSIGVQYSFSPESYKTGNEWSFYDLPSVANYSRFYRMPLGNPEAVADEVANNAGNFGYDEATRHFNLPPSSGQPELNVYGSRSTIDTGIENTLNDVLYNTGTNSLFRRDYQQEITVNNDLGARLTWPLISRGGFQSSVSGGGDYKSYKLSIYKTNIFNLRSVETDTIGGTTTYITNSSTDISPVPATILPLNYVPLNVHLNVSMRDPLGTTYFGLGLSANAWYSGSKSNLYSVISSTRSTGHWLILNPSLSRDFIIKTNWTLSLAVDGQLSNEPLPANEEFGIGGVASVRGYHEGEIFGDEGWHASVELKTPAHLVGIVRGKQPLSIRGSLFMDYAEAYLLDPEGRQSSTPLWSVGVGGVASIGARWDARLIFSVPLDSTAMTPRDQPEFTFAISAQF
jgi:hemolysin activation/secretion protein